MKNKSNIKVVLPLLIAGLTLNILACNDSMPEIDCRELENGFYCNEDDDLNSYEFKCENGTTTDFSYCAVNASCQKEGSYSRCLIGISPKDENCSGDNLNSNFCYVDESNISWAVSCKEGKIVSSTKCHRYNDSKQAVCVEAFRADNEKISFCAEDSPRSDYGWN